MPSSKSSKRERCLLQNPAREREDLLKIQQERERTSSKSSKRARCLLQNPARERLCVYLGLFLGLVRVFHGCLADTNINDDDDDDACCEEYSEQDEDWRKYGSMEKYGMKEKILVWKQETESTGTREKRRLRG